MMPTRIAIADDKQINRSTVKDKIISFKEIELVLEAKNGHDFLEQLKNLPVGKHPQVPDLRHDVIDIGRLVSGRHPEVHQQAAADAADDLSVDGHRRRSHSL